MHARDGVHGPNTKVGPGCLLGARNRGVDRRARTGSRRHARARDAGRADHRRPDALAVLRAARVRDPGDAHRAHRTARLARAETRRQRVADAGTAGRPRDVPRPLPGRGAPGRCAVRSRGGTERHGGGGCRDSRGARLRRDLRPQRAARRARPDDHGCGTAARLLFPFAVRPDGAAAALDGDRDPARRHADCDPAPLRGAVALAHRREELAAAADCRSERAPDPPGRDDARGARRDVAMVTGDGRLDGARHAGGVCARPLTARAAGRARGPEQAVPELPQPRRGRRSARAGTRWRRDAPDTRSADPAGPAGRRQHAGVRQEPHPGGGERAGRVPPDAAAGESTAGAYARGDAPAGARGVMPHADAWPTLATLLAAAIVYTRGWWALSSRMPTRFGKGRIATFLGGLAVITVALASPLDTLAGGRLSAHMVQHQLLIMLAPPLLWLGAPIAPLLLGLPRRIRRRVAAALASRVLRPTAHVIAHPAFGWVSFALAFWIWHAAPLYQLALRSHAWHHVEHACFVATAMLFWRPVIHAWPDRALWPRWTMIPYLLLADLQNTILAAILTFSDRLVYPAYASVTVGRLSALDDQAMAGVIMWVPGSLVFLVAAIWLAMEALSGARAVPGVASSDSYGFGASGAP